MECMANPPGCGLQSLHCSIIANHDDMLFRVVAIFFLDLFFARNPISWRLEWNLQLSTIAYCGVVISALAYYLQTWCISYKGPVFTAMFSPLQVIIVALFSAISFAERLHFGSLIGAFLIIVGLYCVLWGKKERQCCC
ncbi:PREDICTED: WAT1-related protein At5g64700-like [Prunus mume]|uniref:WAT1-related protein n=1 Tax=Prunus mume TaxID=102107 RepID=A0ABM1LJ59_PRUMU|nr:PREDICTED: WAT1-related protein At5g64700-like [Prunus mume]